MNRLFPALSLSLLVSLGLFWLMQFMIMNNQQGFKKTDNLKMVEFVRLKREIELKTKERRIPDKPPPKKQPPPPSMQMAQTSHVTQQKIPNMAVPNLDLPLQASRFGAPVTAGVAGLNTGKGSISTNLMPLVRVNPRYPMRAQSRRIEGWVKVKFTITKTGTVKDAKVIESHPDTIFNRAALRAIARWKFKPEIVDGMAFEQLATQVIQFNLPK